MEGVFFRKFFDYIFPLFCVSCNEEGAILCSTCFENIQFLGVFCCPVCHQKFERGLVCGNCRSTSALDQVAALLPYVESQPFGQIIQAFKYSYSIDARKILARSLETTQTILQTLPLFDIDAIVPIPLHKRRLAERGFNQAEIIAQLISKQVNIPVVPILTRFRATKQQAKLTRVERQENVRDAFVLQKNLSISGKIFLLIDDVYTTGSTMQAAARVLKEAGARAVIGFTLARG